MSNNVLWWKPSEIRFSKVQLKSFILPNLNELREGNYPVAPAGYTSKENRSQLAPFIIAADTAIEIDERLKLIPKSIFIEQYYINDQDIYSIAQREHISIYSLHRELNKMITYLSGYKRKRIDYPLWCLLKRINPNDI